MVGELAERAGVHDAHLLGELQRQALGLGEPGREVVSGRWGDFGACWAIVDRLEQHDCLQIYADQHDFLAGLPAPGEEPDERALDPLVAAFRDACLSLQPEVAFLDTAAHYGDADWENSEGSRKLVLGFYPVVLDRNVNALADERFSLLWLDDELKQHWQSDEVRNDREMVETPHGFLVFGGSGLYRLA